MLDHIKEHVEETQSQFASTMLINWDQERGNFWQICPKEMISRLDNPLTDDEPEAQTA